MAGDAESGDPCTVSEHDGGDHSGWWREGGGGGGEEGTRVL